MTTSNSSASNAAPSQPSPPHGNTAVRPMAARTRLMLEGPIVSTLLRLAAPNLVVNVVLIAVTTSVDAHFVGRFGSDALAGLALVFPLIMLMQQMANFSMGGAIASAVARAIGGGRTDDAAALVIHALLIALGMAALFAAVMLMAGPSIYALLGAKGPILAAAVEYSNAIFCGAAAYWLLSTLTSVVRGTGQMGLLAIVYIAAETLHVLLVPILVFGLGPIPPLGITGAGVATVISFTVSTVVLAWYLASGRTAIKFSRGCIRVDRRQFVEILRVGAPLSLQPVLFNIGLVAITGYAGMLGVTALAAFGIAVRLEYLLYPLNFGLGAAVVAMVGTNVGAGQSDRAIRIAWIAAALGAAVTGGIGVLAVVWPALWIGMFTDAPAIHLMAASYLCVVAFGYAFVGMNTLTSAFQAMGQTLWPLLGNTCRVLVIVAGGWIVVHATDTGLTGLGVVTAAGLMLAGGIIAVAFRLKTRFGIPHP